MNKYAKKRYEYACIKNWRKIFFEGNTSIASFFLKNIYAYGLWKMQEIQASQGAFVVIGRIIHHITNCQVENDAFPETIPETLPEPSKRWKYCILTKNLHGNVTGLLFKTTIRQKQAQKRPKKNKKLFLTT